MQTLTSRLQLGRTFCHWWLVAPPPQKPDPCRSTTYGNSMLSVDENVDESIFCSFSLPIENLTLIYREELKKQQFSLIYVHILH